MEAVSGSSATGVASMLSSATNATQSLRYIRNLPGTMYELKNQLLSFQSLLEAILVHPSYNEAIEKEVRQASVTLEETVSVVQSYSDHKSKIGIRAAWGLRDQTKVKSLRQKMDRHISTIGVLLSVEEMKRSRQSDDSVDVPEIIIPVMGETGSGKSRFIQQITQSSEVRIGHSMSSETKAVQAYSITVEGRIITLVDTPGFDDTTRSDVDVLKEVSSWLTQSYKSRQLVSGIIYLHPITSTRMRGSALSNLKMFASLVGPDSFHNIVLVTTMWDLLSDPSLGEAREEDLRQHFWANLIEKGSITARSSGDRKSALAVMKRVAFDKRMGPISGAPLAIQKEMVDEQRPLDLTTAGEMLARRMDRMEQEYVQGVKDIRRENEEEMNRMQTAIRRENEKIVERMQIEINALKEDQLRLKKERPARNQTQKSRETTPHTNTSVYVRLNVSELLEVDSEPPPPYPSRETFRVLSFAEPLTNIIAFSLMPVFELRALVGPLISRYLRPRLQKHYSRIEWTCTCGDLLYGDYIERKPGSLHTLAIQLGGKIVSGPACQQSVASSSNGLPQFPPQAHTGGRSTIASHSATTPAQPSNSNQQHHGPRLGTGSSDNTNAAVTQQAAITNKWLELCIRSSPNTFVLGEIDIAGTQTDQAIFEAIRHKYESNRVAAQLFGRFAYRVPNGGVAVQFRKDKIASANGDPATASIMARSSMPGIDDAKRYHYVFDPTPMDEPPIDTHTFNHYFHKPHLGDSFETWMTRFPQLHDSSLFWGNEKLAKGWGFEITEERNWTLFFCANLIVLLISGIVAGVSAYYMKDNATGVAIGAWLTAVQTLVVSALFWRWTN